MLVSPKPDEPQRAEAAMGTLGYMAPEVLTGEAADTRADIFAVGAMVVETIVGVRPFAGRTLQEFVLALVQGDYHVPGESAEIRALDAIVQRCLAKAPRNRYGSAAELTKDLIPTLSRCGGVAAHLDLATSDSPTVGERTRP